MVFVVLLATQCLVSCAWNRAFLAPEPIPSGDRFAMRIDAVTADTSFLSISGPNSQPVFLNSERKAMDLPYTIESYMIGPPGERINGWYIRATDRPPEITLLFMHGNGGNIYTEYLVMLPLVERGASIYMLDYRGYGRSEGRATRKNVIEDAEAFVKDALIRTQGSGMPVVLYGQSLGGHTAAVISGSLPAGIDGMVIEGGFISFKDMARHSGGLGAIGAWLTKEGPGAEEELAKYVGPLLVIHSPDDMVVPIEQAEKLFSVRQSRDRLVKLPGPHASAPLLHPDTVMAEIRKLQQR